MPTIDSGAHAKESNDQRSRLEPAAGRDSGGAGLRLRGPDGPKREVRPGGLADRRPAVARLAAVPAEHLLPADRVASPAFRSAMGGAAGPGSHGPHGHA